MQVVAATDFSTRSNRAVRQAGLLARNSRAHVHLLHVVDDDQPEDLIAVEKREAERILAEQIKAMPELQGVRCNPIVVTSDPFDGILRVAAEVNADLIVMGSHRKQFLLDVFVGTTIERVIRTGPFPVLMVNNEAQRQYERVVAPVDMSEASANALRMAVSAGLIKGDGATLLHAFLPPARGKMFIGAADQTSIENYVASEGKKASDELAGFLVANDLGHVEWSLRIEEGDPMSVITQIVAELQPDLLVMARRGRSRFLETLIGSVTEAALRSLSVDIFVAPAVSR
jgi:nucleotide-binding universal stress UspA family protein